MNFISLCRVPEPTITAAEAFEYFIDDMSFKNRPEVHVAHRGFTIVLRPADVAVNDFIDKKLKSAGPQNPVWCLKDPQGYIFFGSLENK